EPSWGRHKNRTKPSPGNHDYNTSGATGYYNYFGANAGSPSTGYYSYNLGSWHVVVLNSNCSAVGGCGVGSAQEQWLRSDLAANPGVCTLSYWHHPRFSSGSTHGSNTAYQPFWQALYDYKADVILVGHEHNYERFSPQDPAGASDPGRGIRQFVVGTGGRSHYGFGTILTNSEVRNGDTYGVLKLTLKQSSYSWQFIPEAGKSFTDSGESNCVN
ncbi:MAG TPA: metallophosphoesterase, partial [Patescibacteria group bacterium]|nr:metallophosphoesterase [Patescibacteria group bacterium]